MEHSSCSGSLPRWLHKVVSDAWPWHVQEGDYHFDADGTLVHNGNKKYANGNGNGSVYSSDQSSDIHPKYIKTIYKQGSQVRALPPNPSDLCMNISATHAWLCIIAFDCATYIMRAHAHFCPSA